MTPAEQTLADEDGLDGLPSRVRNLLWCHGWTTRSAVREALESGSLSTRVTNNYGRKGHADVCEWLGLPLPQKPAPTKPTLPTAAELDAVDWAAVQNAARDESADRDVYVDEDAAKGAVREALRQIAEKRKQAP